MVHPSGMAHGLNVLSGTFEIVFNHFLVSFSFNDLFNDASFKEDISVDSFFLFGVI